MGSNRRFRRLMFCSESTYHLTCQHSSPNKTQINNQHIVKVVSFCAQVLQAQVDRLGRGEGDIAATCSQTQEAIALEASVASLQSEQELGERLAELSNLRLPYQPEENDQLDLLMETDGLRKSIHNLGTIVTTR